MKREEIVDNGEVTAAEGNGSNGASPGNNGPIHASSKDITGFRDSDVNRRSVCFV